MWIRLGAVLVLPVALVGCGGRTDATGRTVPDLDGTSWVATAITEDGQARALVPGTELRVDFADGDIRVTGGCNTLGGRYHLSEKAELRADELASTTMGCDQPRTDQDSWLSGTVFASPLVASLDGDTLVLARAGLELTLTDRRVASPDAALVGTHWELDGVRTGDTVSSVPAGHTPTLSIGAGGAVTLHTGCNGGTTSATVHDATITFAPATTTKMACADRSGRETEAAVLGVLDGDVEWSITEQTLTLTKGDRGLLYRAAS
jgi:heat shock protein HslJ